MGTVKVVFDRDEQGIPSEAEIKIGRKKLNAKWVYSPTKRVYKLELKGKRGVLPSFAEVVALVDAMRASEMGIFKEKGEETRVYRKLGNLAKLTDEVIVDIKGRDVEITHLEFSCNHKNMAVQIYPYKADGELDDPIGVLAHDGSDYHAINPLIINTHESIMWLELKYDDTAKLFKFGLGYPERFANGVKIERRNPDTSAHNVALEVHLLVRG